jgi:hypothetical protein
MTRFGKRSVFAQMKLCRVYLGIMVVGFFELEPLAPGRWRVRNTFTEISHVTYGTKEEVTEVLQQATAAWQRRLGPQKRGNKWRENMKGEADENTSRMKARQDANEARKGR